MKSILVIGGGELGLNQVKWAKEVGFHVIVTDKNPNAPGLADADLGLTIDATDVASLAAFALANQAKFNIRAIYCGNDFGLVSVAVVSHVLKLPGNPVEAILRSLDKKLMKTRWLEDNISTPKGILVESLNHARTAINELGLPAVVKPSNSSGSRGVLIIESADTLESNYAEATRHSTTNQVLLEQFIAGTHHDVNGLFWGGKFYGCGVMDRYFSQFPYCVAIAGYDPSILSPEVKEKLYALLEKAVRSLGITFGPVKGDFIITAEGKICLFEVSARFHGDVFTSYTSPRSTKVNPIKVYMKTLYENKFSAEDLACSDNLLSAWQVLKVPVGRVKEINGLQEAEQVAGIDKVIFRVNEGDKIKHMQNNSDVPGFVWASGRSRHEIDNSYEAFYKKFKVEYYSN